MDTAFIALSRAAWVSVLVTDCTRNAAMYALAFATLAGCPARAHKAATTRVASVSDRVKLIVVATGLLVGVRGWRM